MSTIKRTRSAACLLGCALATTGGCDAPGGDTRSQSGPPATLHYVTTADQIGPVFSYRAHFWRIAP